MLPVDTREFIEGGVAAVNWVELYRQKRSLHM